MYNGKSVRRGKPLLFFSGERWKVNGTYLRDEYPRRNPAAQGWADRRNYFIAIKAGIGLGRSLDCRARGCPVPQDDVVKVQRAPHREPNPLWRNTPPGDQWGQDLAAGAIGAYGAPPAEQEDIGNGPFN